MTEEINKQEQAKRQSELRIGLTVGMVMLIGLITLSGCSNNGASADKIYKVDELAAAALADKDAWKGKEVAVTGYVSETSGASARLLVTMNNDRETQKTGVTCSLQGVKADDVFGKTINVKGKIASSSADGEDKKVNLEPCELKK